MDMSQCKAKRSAGHLLLSFAWGFHVSVRLQGDQQPAAAAAALQLQEELHMATSVGAAAPQMPSPAPQHTDQVRVPFCLSLSVAKEV